MKKICPCCRQAFECHADDIRKCDCIKVHTSAAARTCMNLYYPDECLCFGCLSAFASLTDDEIIRML
jgi:hypothetical protein